MLSFRGVGATSMEYLGLSRTCDNPREWMLAWFFTMFSCNVQLAGKSSRYSAFAIMLPEECMTVAPVEGSHHRGVGS